MKTLNRIQTIYNSAFYYPLLWFLYLAVAGVFFYIADLPNGKIESLLIPWVPWNLRADLFLVLIGTLLCRSDIAGAVGGLFRSTDNPDNKPRWNYRGFLLLGLILAAFLMSSLVVPRVHRIFYDEDIYGAMGQAIAETGRTGHCTYATFDYGEYTPTWLSYYKEPSGWPFLLSLVFQLFGTGELQGFILNNLILAAGVGVVFFIVRAIGGGFFPAFLAALVYALIPHNLIWSNTMAAEPSAALFAGLAVLCLAVYLRSGRPRHLFLTAAVLPLACQMRAESGLILVWTFLALMIFRSSEFRREGKMKAIWTAGLPVFIMLVPHLLHFVAMGGESWGAQGAKFSLDYLGNNLAVNGPYYFNNAAFPALFSVLALIGVVLSRTNLRWRLLMGAWFLLAWGVFLFFYAGSFRYGADVRFALVTFMPLSVLAGLGAEHLRARLGTGETVQGQYRKRTIEYSVLVIILLFAWIPFLPQVRTIGREAWGARYDHLYALEFIKKIPDRSIVLTHVPTLFLMHGKSAIQADAAIHHPDIIQDLMWKYNGQVYFHYNYWCNIDGDPNPKVCRAIQERYSLEEVASAREQNYDYGLYKITFKK